VLYLRPLVGCAQQNFGQVQQHDQNLPLVDRILAEFLDEPQS
jgi:hypothetical protein